jgi:hypothetical protein
MKREAAIEMALLVLVGLLVLLALGARIYGHRTVATPSSGASSAAGK